MYRYNHTVKEIFEGEGYKLLTPLCYATLLCIFNIFNQIGINV